MPKALMADCVMSVYTNWFMNLKQARNIIEDWRRDYNEVRPHSSLKNMTPMEYANATTGF